MTMALVAALFIAICVSLEALASRAHRLSPELVRKLAHMSAALLAALLPLVVSFAEIVLLGLFFGGLMAVSKSAGIFTAIHGVSRSTYGEVFFPLGIAALALACPRPLPYAYGVLVLGLGDGLAALVGERIGQRPVPLLRTRKTLWGSGTFVAACFALGIAVLVPTGVSPAYAVGAAAAMAIVLAPVELLLTNGFDNLALPVLAGVLVTGL